MYLLYKINEFSEHFLASVRVQNQL